MRPGTLGIADVRVARELRSIREWMESMVLAGAAADRPASAPVGATYQETEGAGKRWVYAGALGWLQIYPAVAGPAGYTVVVRDLVAGQSTYAIGFVPGGGEPVLVFVNGVLRRVGAAYDYTVVGANVVLTADMVPGISEGHMIILAVTV